MQKMTTLTTTQKTILLTGLLALCVTGLPNMAEAQELFSAGTNFLQALVDLLTNTWARLLGVISVVSIGVAALFQRLTWMAAGFVVFGLVLIFGAATIVDSVNSSI